MERLQEMAERLEKAETKAYRMELMLKDSIAREQRAMRIIQQRDARIDELARQLWETSPNRKHRKKVEASMDYQTALGKGLCNLPDKRLK